MRDLIENVGKGAISFGQLWYETFFFSILVLRRMISPGTYNSAVWMVLINQIYFTSIQILPLFLFVSVIFGIVFIGFLGHYLREIGLFGFFGHMLMVFVVREFAPFITVLLVALRSGSAINTEMAVMKVNREIKSLELFGIDPLNYLYVPRVLSGIISILLLSAIFSIVVIVSGIFFSNVFFDMSISDYTSILVESASFTDILVMFVKCAIFGFFIVLIPLRFGLQATQELTSIPISVLNGMINVFIAIVFIEVFSLILGSLLEKLS
ncbi:MAG: ABC transporter permease [Syntrophales bacterium]|nr:ABC transporter permease [Syntrophales bacterium]